jgi:hypothetical protein
MTLSRPVVSSKRANAEFVGRVAAESVTNFSYHPVEIELSPPTRGGDPLDDWHKIGYSHNTEPHSIAGKRLHRLALADCVRLFCTRFPANNSKAIANVNGEVHINSACGAGFDR